MASNALQLTESLEHATRLREVDRRDRYDLIAEVARKVSERRAVRQYDDLSELSADYGDGDSDGPSLNLQRWD